MENGKIQKLESIERVAEYEVDKLLELMNIKGNEIILDVGAGTGVFSIPIAELLHTGCVNAIDIDKNLLAIINDKVDKKGIDNIKTILLEEGMPVLEGTADKVFVCVVLHEVDDKEKFLTLYNKCLKPGGAIYIVEFNSSKRRLNDTSNIKRAFIKNCVTEKLLKSSGYIDVKTSFENELIYMTEGYKQ